jgi:hypothetical protein
MKTRPCLEVEEESQLENQPSTTSAGTPPAIEEVIAPHMHIPTNDGTHRITVKWTSPTDVSEFETDKRRLNEALGTLMQTMFKDTDGVFY